MNKINWLFLMPFIILAGCNSQSNSPTTLSDFNLTDITADNSGGNIKRMTLTWDSPLAGNTSGTDITYTVCQYSSDATDNCDELATVTNSLSADISVNSLVDVIDNSYFIMAKSATSSAQSSSMQLSAETLAQMIGYFKASDQQSYHFGQAIAISNDASVMAIGANGSVYLYTRSSAQKWTLVSSESGNSYFGAALALNGDGSLLAVTDRTTNGGSVYLYPITSSGIDTDNVITFTNTGLDEDGHNKYDRFGASVALSSDGSTLAVGASTYLRWGVGDDFDRIGAALVYRTNGSDWSSSITPALIEADNAGASDYFGYSVSLNSDGSRVAIGAYGEDSSNVGTATTTDSAEDDSSTDSGAVYVYDYDTTNSEWSLNMYLKAQGGIAAEDNHFGYSVSLSNSGDTLAIGMPGYGHGGVVVFNYTDASWEQYETVIEPSNGGNSDDQFGYAVALSADGTQLAVGMPDEDSASFGIDSTYSTDDDVSSTGAVYSYYYVAQAGWVTDHYLKAPNADAEDQFGASVAISNSAENIFVGAPNEDSSAVGISGDQSDNDADSTGAVYIY